MRAAEQAAFASGVQVEALMNKAGAGIAQAVTKFFQKPGRCIVFAGKGHNAGDALFAAQCLERRGWKIEVRLAFKEADCSDLTRKKLGDLCRRPAEILGAVPSKTANKDLVATFIELSRRHRPDSHDAGFNPDRSSVRTLLLRSSFWMVCSALAQNHRSASRSAPLVAPSINCEQQRPPTSLRWIFQLVSIPIQARQIATA